MSWVDGLHMRAAVLDGNAGGSFTIHCLPVSQPAHGEVLVKLEACGVCHTDLHVWKGTVRPGSGKPPAQILGHEGIGRVVATGPGVDRFVTGDRVGVPGCTIPVAPAMNAWQVRSPFVNASAPMVLM